MQGRCAHCKKRPHRKARRLCWKCCEDPKLRAKYASGSKYARRGVAIANKRKMPSPTSARPGSLAKIDVMRRRAAAGEQVFHPQDAR